MYVCGVGVSPAVAVCGCGCCEEVVVDEVAEAEVWG